MYDNRRPRIVHSQPAFDIHQIIKEAQIRWLKPVEVIEILQNYQIFRLNPVPPNKPPSGSLFLFDRKTLRFFRKDGHNWRKKKDGKTVREAHERLKAGSVDVLHCYYAHGEDNPNFQRRSYWMLEGAYEHIVLVHYREVSEGSRPSVLRSPIQDSSSSQGFSGINRDLTDLASISRTNVVVPPAVISSPGYSELEVTGPYKSPESGDPIGIPDDGIDSRDEIEDASSVGLEETTNPLLQQLWTVDDSSNMANEILMQHDARAKFPENQGLANVSTSMGTVPDGQQHVQSGYTLNLSGCNALLETFRGALAAQTSAEYFKGASDWPVKLGQGTEKGKEKIYLDSLPSFGSFHPLHYVNNGKQDLSCVERDVEVCKEEQDQKGSQLKGNGMNIEEQQMDVDLQHPRCHGDSNVRKQPSRIFELQDAECHVGQGGNEHLKKLDSFGRWMSREIGDDSQSSFLSGSTDRGACWTPIEDQFDEISSLSNQIQLDTGPTPSLSQDQQFTIIEFSPDWSFATEETKVVIVGSFLKGSNSFTENTWCCMFGEIEVPAEVIQDGVLRCKAPPHNSGTVPFYVTLGDRLACSEIREFHYRVHNSGASGHLIQSSLFTSFQQEDMQLQLRFLRILMGSGNTEDKLPEDTELDNALQTSAYDFKECVVQILLKKRLQEWISNAITGHGQITPTLDNKGQSLLHIVAALGYDWAISPLLAAGVGVNFRDVQGWTALHWAAFRGREKVVVALLAAEAGPGLLTDPTPRHPNGQTPADLAASSGHGGIAGYLAEMSLTSHLSSLTLKEKATNEIDNFSAVLAGEKAVEYVSEKGDILEKSRDNDENSLQESLRAVRNAARAAALIHATFRQESFRRRQETTDTTYDSDYGMSRRDMKSMLLQQKALHHRKEHSAAVQIQRKFRSWKGRRDFLVLRQRVVKIQAHFRGHQVRKKFRRLLWSVGILEKAVLRWRRKRVGLRGFHVETSSAETVGNGQSNEEEDVLKAGRKQKEAAIEKAVTRVQAMVRCHLARAQYQRLLKGQQQALNGVIGKMHQMNSSLSEPVDNDQEMTTESSMLEVRR